MCVKNDGHHRHEHRTHHIFTHWIWGTCLQSNRTASFIALFNELFIVRRFFVAVVVLVCVDHQWHYTPSPSLSHTQERFLIGMLFMISHSKMRIHQNVILTTIHIFSWKTFHSHCRLWWCFALISKSNWIYVCVRLLNSNAGSYCRFHFPLQ